MSAGGGQVPDGLRLRRAGARGRVAGVGGIDAVEAFSRADAIDPAWMGWGALRVLSTQSWPPGAARDEGRVANMERLLLVLSGALDADGGELGRQRVEAGAILWIGAGHGVAVRLANASSTEPLGLVEAWLQPDRVNAPPRMELRPASPAAGGEQAARSAPGWTLLAAGSPASAGPLPIRLQAQLMSACLAPGSSLDLPACAAGRYWLEVIDGEVVVQAPPAVADPGLRLLAGDGAAWCADGLAPRTVAAVGDRPARMLLLALPA